MNKADFLKTKLFLQHLQAGDISKLKNLEISLNEVDELILLKKFFTKEALPEGNSELCHTLLAWKYYYNADYQQALKMFQPAISNQNGWHSWAYLGIGKVASDLLAFKSASSFLLKALAIARTENDLVRMSECYGALGEVAFRNEKYQLAYELFSLDKALLSPGSYQESRLANYLSICQGRLGHYELANISLKENFFSTLNTDSLSSDYSLASIYMNCMVNNKLEEIETLNELDSLHEVQSELPKGVILIAKSWIAKNNHKEWKNYLKLAKECFLHSYPFEYEYVKLLEGNCEEDFKTLKQRINNLPNLPEFVTVLDRYIEDEFKDETDCRIFNLFINSENPWMLIKHFFI